ncbi:MAG: NfeD family protein [Rugosibacter sp.]
MQILWWHWMVLGLGLALSELALFSFFIIWFALGALLVGLALLLSPELSFTTQILLWTVASVLMTVSWFKFFRNTNKTHAGQAAAVIGEVGTLVRAIEPFNTSVGGTGSSGRGEVRFQKPVMGTDTWPCIADEFIAAGTRVKVVGVDGQFLKVGKPAANATVNATSD